MIAVLKDSRNALNTFIDKFISIANDHKPDEVKLEQAQNEVSGVSSKLVAETTTPVSATFQFALMVNVMGRTFD